MSNTKNLDFDHIRELVKLLKETGLNEIEVSEGDSSVRLRLSAESTTIMQTPVDATSQTSVPAPTTAKPVSENCFTAPMVGTFYRSSSPEAAPFINVGDKIEKGQTLCVIEAMKTFNQIEADRDGIIKDIITDDASPVEFGQPLFELE